MSIAEIIAEYVPAVEGPRSILLLAGARHLAERVPGAGTYEPGDPRPGGAAILVGAARPGGESDEVDTVATAVHEGDVLVLLLGATPTELRVGPLVQSVTAGGLRVVRIEELEAPLRGTLLIACRGALLPRASYLLGEAIPDTERAYERLANEWAIEGLQLRAVAGMVAAAHAAAEEADRAAQETRLAAQQAVRSAQEATRATQERVRAAEDVADVRGRELTALRAELAALHAELAVVAKSNRELRVLAKRGPGWRIKRAAALVKDDPVEGTKHVLRSVTGRVRG
ncbi:MAG: hypothetical protein L0H25_00220 [Micrococcales bacterium]|nr:hypothetical protein [Micrococcales bacterium]